MKTNKEIYDLSTSRSVIDRMEAAKLATETPILRALAKDEYIGVRLPIASKGIKEHAAIFAKDKDIKVRVAYVKSAPIEELHRFENDESKEVRAAVKLERYLAEKNFKEDK